MKEPTYRDLARKSRKPQRENGESPVDNLSSKIERCKLAEFERHPYFLRMSAEQKARWLLLGRLVGEHKKLSEFGYPERDSFIEEECVWAVVALLRSRTVPKWLKHQIAAILVPDSDHGLAHPHLSARLVRRKQGALRNDYAHQQIISAVASFELDGLSRNAAVEEVSEWYGVTREYVYECLREGQSAS